MTSRTPPQLKRELNTWIAHNIDLSASADSLTHHGILGMKWGRRRYQKANGERTPLGKKHESTLASSPSGASASSKVSIPSVETSLSKSDKSAIDNKIRETLRDNIETNSEYPNSSMPVSVSKSTVKGIYNNYSPAKKDVAKEIASINKEVGSNYDTNTYLVGLNIGSHDSVVYTFGEVKTNSGHIYDVEVNLTSGKRRGVSVNG